MTYLSKEDWAKLDDLLSKHGFGGYYDLVECLKTVVARVGKGKLKKDWDLEKIDLPSIVQLLMKITGKEKKKTNDEE